MKRSITSILSDLLIKATPLSPFPDGYKNYLIGQEFIYEIQEYLDLIQKKADKTMNEEKFCVDCKFHQIFRHTINGVEIGDIKHDCHHKEAMETDLVTGEKSFLSCADMRDGPEVAKSSYCGFKARFFEKKEI